MFLGIKISWALLRAQFNPHLTVRAKMSLSWAQNLFMPANINYINLLSLGPLSQPFSVVQRVGQTIREK